MMKSFTTSLCNRAPLHKFVLLFLLALLFIVPATAHAQSEPEKDILDIASESGNFRVLIAYLKAAGLDETLKGDGPFTIFAPSDSAFVKIPLPKIKELRDDPDGDLTDILLYHGIEGKVTAVDILEFIDEDVDSLNGLQLAITEEDGVVMVNGAAIIATDIEASNGIIHVIDTVLVPPAIEDAWGNAIAMADAADSSDGEMAEGEEEAADLSDGEMAEGDDDATNDSSDGEMAEGDEEAADDSSSDEMTESDEEAAADSSDGEMAEGEEEAADGSSDDEMAEGDEEAADDSSDGEMAESDEDADADSSDGEMVESDEEAAADSSDGEMAEGEEEAADLSDGEMAESDEAADSSDGEMAESDEEAAADDSSDGEMAESDEEAAADDSSDGEMAESDEEAAADSSDDEMDAGDEEAADDSSAVAPAFDILDTANNAGNFTTLVAAIYTANLNEVLKGEGPFTIFAPADSAFATMPAGSVQALLDLPKEELAEQLLLHVVPGELLATDIVQLVNSDIETANAELLPIRANETGIAIGNATMVATDIQTSNGIIHIIDQMLDQSAFGALASAAAQPAAAQPAAAADPVAVPTAAPAEVAPAAPAPAAPASTSRGADLVDTAVAAGNFNTLVAAIKAANLDETLRTGESFTIFAPTASKLFKPRLPRPSNLLPFLTGYTTYRIHLIN